MALPRRPQPVDATERQNTSDGFIHPSVCLGRLYLPSNRRQVGFRVGAQVRELRREKELLGKAAAFFASQKQHGTRS